MGEKAASRHLLRTKNLKALMNLNESDKPVGDSVLLSELNAKENGPQRL